MQRALSTLFTLWLLAATALPAADGSYWMEPAFVRRYVHNSEMQRRWAMAFLAPHLRQLRGDEAILDIGCGDGKISADLSRFVPHGHVAAIDPSDTMLHWAHQQYGSGEYPNLLFQRGGFSEPNVEGHYDLVVSHCALQHSQDQELAFRNIAALLKDGGKALLLLPALDNEAWNSARQRVQSDGRWSSYWQGALPRRVLRLDDYRRLLQQAGLVPRRIARVATQDPFVDRDELLTFLLGTMTPAVPDALARAFFDDLIDQYLALQPEALRRDGVIEMRFGRIEIEASKE